MVLRPATAASLELIRNANSQTPSQISSDTLGLGLRNLCVEKLCFWSWCMRTWAPSLNRYPHKWPVSFNHLRNCSRLHSPCPEILMGSSLECSLSPGRLTWKVTGFAGFTLIILGKEKCREDHLWVSWGLCSCLSLSLTKFLQYEMDTLAATWLARSPACQVFLSLEISSFIWLHLEMQFVGSSCS